MSERPILFSAPMVRAILAGTKTQTRRAIKPSWSRCLDLSDPDDRNSARAGCPYGRRGDRLWVRETWGLFDRENFGGRAGFGVAWRATHPMPEDGVEWIDGPDDYADRWVASDRWRPSIHMPRWASRITLDVLSVRVERLHDIAEEDAQAEGVEPAHDGSYVNAYSWLWREIHGPGSWAANPWVWRIEVRRVQP